MFGRRQSKQHQSNDESPDAYHGLRSMALDAVARGLVATSPEHGDVAGIIVDIPAKGGFVTIVGLADGTASMYTSVGGGMLGAGAHATVMAAVEQALAEAQRNIGLFESPDDHGLPPAGSVRFHVLTSPEGRCADVPADAFWGREAHRLMPVITTVQHLITALSAVSPPNA